MTKEIVDYIKSHVQMDIDLNKDLSGINLSAGLGAILNTYLDTLPDESAVLVAGLVLCGDLERRMEEASGMPIIVHETRKCGVPILESVGLNLPTIVG